MLTYCQLHPYEQTSVKFQICIKIQQFSSKEITPKMLSAWRKIILFHPQCVKELPVTQKNSFNSLWLSDIIWRQRSESALTSVIASFLTTPSHYLNQCWLPFSAWHSPKSNFTVSAQVSIMYNEFRENYNFEIIATSLKFQWVISSLLSDQMTDEPCIQ